MKNGKNNDMGMPKYNYPVSLIPGGCPQFLDFDVDLDAMDPKTLRFTRAFREKRRPEAQGDGREAFELICLAAGHSLLADMDPDSAFDLMLYFEFHIIFPRMFVNKKHLQ